RRARERNGRRRRQRVEPLISGIGPAVEKEREDHIEEGQHAKATDRNDPIWYALSRPLIGGAETFPMRREAALEIAAIVAYEAKKILANHDEFRSTARHHAILALETQADAEIEELEQIEINRRVALQLVEQVPKTIAANDLVVEGCDHAPLR